MDKTLMLSLFPFFAVLLLIGVVALHVRKGKSLNLRLEGFGVKFSIQSGNGGLNNEVVTSDTGKET